MRVLIICPHLHCGGGVANYFLAIRDYLTVDADFFEIGARNEVETTLEKISHLYSDRTRLLNLLRSSSEKYDLIHINPSFLYRSLVRDGLLLRVAKRFDKKTIVFFRGWSDQCVEIVNKHYFSPFFSTYSRADAFVVLASDFVSQIRDWGFKQPVYIETTLVDDKLLKGFSLEKRLARIEFDHEVRLLYLARIEKDKGICETIEAVRKLSAKDIHLHLVVAGDGAFMEKARQFAAAINIADKISFVGYLRGEEKKKMLMDSDIYVLPTCHGEGMPNSVLEAMAFGLPVVTRPVGGLKDFFKNGEHGFITDSKNPSVIASLVERIIRNKDLWAKMSSTAHQFAKERFLASKVAARLEDIYNRTLR